ncbi:TonB-dependent receptor [Emcibacter sp.]|uniref:TonB-dependent receptor n=1 Tax=Emcibacter sp. TaxID=1979954 RepID=UPI002AA7AE42|nr:TonB-dependent receptor [Emcibacter sp.]
MSYLKYLKNTSALISISVLATVAHTAQAQEDNSAILEEIVVTSQYREQSLSDVPISVSVVGGAQLEEQSIERMADLQFAVPNFTMAESGIGTNVFMRGIGSGNNQGFEQSVGVYVDGIHHGRAQQTRQPFLDLERVEVLRGPQSILFGKNSVAGALNMTTAKPTEEFEGYVSGAYEFVDTAYEVTGVLSGPLSDTMRVRVAGRYHDKDGYIDNLTLDRKEPQQEDWAVRGILEWDLSEDLQATFKVERSAFDVVGRNIEIANELPNGAFPTGDPLAGMTYSQILVYGFGQDASVLNNTLNGQRSANGDWSNNDATEAVMTLNYAMGDHMLESITGYSKFKYDEVCDCDFTGANVFSLPIQEEYEQFSQEIRLTSPGGETIDYILGAYFQTSDHDYKDQFLIDDTSVLVPALNTNPNLAPFAPLFGALSAYGFTGAGDLLANTATPRQAHVDADVYSAFAQLTWNINEQFSLQLGGRLTHEKKSGTKSIWVENIDGTPLEGVQQLAPDFSGLVFDLATSNAIAGNLEEFLTPFFGAPTAAALAAGYGSTFAGNALVLGSFPVAVDRSETKFTPDIKLQYRPNDDVMLYASFSKGSKSGGFDFRGNNKAASATMADAFEYEDEKATNYEVGGKLTLADGAAELNFAGFFTKYKDLQVSIFDGTLGFNVGNAARAEAKGVELDGRWQVAEGLTLTGSLAWLDFEFKDYFNGQCYFGQTPDSVVNGVNFCDYSGETNQLASKWQGSVGIDHSLNLTDDILLNTNVNMYFTSEYHASANLNPNLMQDGYAKLNARIALTDADNTWELAVLGQNLTDKKILLFGGETPLAGSSFGAQSTYNFLSQGRTIMIQGTYNF